MLVIVAVILFLWIIIGWLALAQFHKITSVAISPKSAKTSAPFHTPAFEVATKKKALKKDIEDKRQGLRRRLLNKQEKLIPHSYGTDPCGEGQHLLTVRESPSITKSHDRKRNHFHKSCPENSWFKQFRSRPGTIYCSGASACSDLELKDSSEVSFMTVSANTSDETLSRESGSYSRGVRQARSSAKAKIIAEYLKNASEALKVCIYTYIYRSAYAVFN